jgi:membrane protein required for colicin V production
MTSLDWILITIGALSALWGVWRGLVREVLSLVGWGASFVLAQMHAAQVGAWLPLADSNDTLRQLAGFVVVFVLVLVLSTVLATLLKKLASAAGLGPLDRLLGGLFGALRGLLLLLSITIVVGLTSWREHTIWQQSVMAQWLQDTLHALRPLLPTEFGRYLN